MGFGLENLASAVMGAVAEVAEAGIKIATEVADVIAAQADIANILEDGQIDEDEQDRLLDDIHKLVVGAYLVGFGSIKFGSEDCSVSSWDDDSENYIIDFIQPNKVTDGAAVTFNENGYSDPKSVWDCFVGLKNYVEDKASDAYTATKNTFDKVKSVGYAIENGVGKFSTSTREGFNAVGEFLGLDYDRKQAGGKTQRELNEEETQRDNENSNKLRNEAPDKEIFDTVSKGTEKSLDAASLVLAAHGIINLGKAGMNLINLERDAWKMERNIKGAGEAGKNSLNIVKETDMFVDYVNESGTVIRVPKQTPQSIADSISKNLGSTDIGVSTEAKVADFIKNNTDATITDFGNKVKSSTGNLLGDIDVATENSLIEVKASISSVKEKQLYKYIDSSKNTYINTGNKQSILYIDEPIDMTNPNNVKLLEKIKDMGITVVNDINELKGMVK